MCICFACNPTQQVETGADDPDRIGTTRSYYGNYSLSAAMDSTSILAVYGTDGSQDTPRKWEGFGEYKLKYMLRDGGLNYLGNETLVRPSPVQA